MSTKGVLRISPTEHKDAMKFLKLQARCFDMRAYKDRTYFLTPALSYLWSYKATIGGKMVGGITAWPTRQGGWYIDSLFVHPSYRRHNIGSKLMSKVMRLAGKKKIILSVKTDRPFLVEFYKKNGFRLKKLSKNHYAKGDDRYIFERN